MVTDDERREVARRLRDKKAECEERGYPWMCDDLILALGYDHDYEAGDEIFDRLADLIEPEPVTEGDPPYNLYSLYEAVLRRHPRSEYAIEDDEVDELVDALLDICNAPGHELIQRSHPSCNRDALLELAGVMQDDAAICPHEDCREHIEVYARRIREALGVDDGD